MHRGRVWSFLLQFRNFGTDLIVLFRFCGGNTSVVGKIWRQLGQKGPIHSREIFLQFMNSIRVDWRRRSKKFAFIIILDFFLNEDRMKSFLSFPRTSLWECHTSLCIHPNDSSSFLVCRAGEGLYYKGALLTLPGLQIGQSPFCNGHLPRSILSHVADERS